jgi:tRNA-specific 2-thiouridylase
MESSNRCCTPEAMALARRVSARLEIPFYAVDAQEIFHDQVVDYFIDGYRRGITPNPCLVCNRQVRWEFLLQRALSTGADYMATGHYARLRTDDTSGIQLLRAVDHSKDQSYVLHVLGQEQLSHALFPLGDLTKPQVRELARQFDLPVAERSESQDLCFLAGNDYRGFLSRHAPQVIHPGPIFTRDGHQIGFHQGMAFYTIGQRKGLGVSNPRPLYVLAKDQEQNALIVGEENELGQAKLTTTHVNWISGKPPLSPFRAQVKIRYRAKETGGTINPQDGNCADVRFDQPMRDITPGQAAVFYDGEVCLGGGIIQV